MEIQFPFTPPLDQPTKIVVHTGSGRHEIQFEGCDQYTLQGESFSRAILNDTPVPTPLEDAAANMKVIDGIVKSSREKAWVRL